MAKYIMFQGTSSHVGKSILATAFCRIFAREGLKTVPFKAQNMALNSFVTPDGGEIGRAQAVQAEAAGLIAETDMNPVLLKPAGNCRSQVIINGVPVGNMSAEEYHLSYSLKAFEAVKTALTRLDKEYDMIVLEGAGSPAEINLKNTDIVNMRVAEYVHAPIFLVADIDRGGSLAALVGTLELLDEAERDLVKGLIINKFRGDPRLFDSAVRFLEEKTGKPVIGIMPYISDLGIDEEDSVSLAEMLREPEEKDLKIAVVRTPRISNFTDFDSLASEEDVSLYYAQEPEALAAADIILLPGTKNTIDDMIWLRESGMEQAVLTARRQGVLIGGICGGYQILGRKISDPDGVEAAHESVDGLNFLPMETVFKGEKITAQVHCRCCRFSVYDSVIDCNDMKGYEIHMGRSVFSAPVSQPFAAVLRRGRRCDDPVGASLDGTVFGTYVHGIFDNDGFRRAFLNAVRIHKGLQPITAGRHYRGEKEKRYDRLADLALASLNMRKVRQIIGE